MWGYRGSETAYLYNDLDGVARGRNPERLETPVRPFPRHHSHQHRLAEHPVQLKLAHGISTVLWLPVHHPHIRPAQLNREEGVQKIQRMRQTDLIEADSFSVDADGKDDVMHPQWNVCDVYRDDLVISTSFAGHIISRVFHALADALEIVPPDEI